MREQTGELLEPMARVARMIEGHLEGIVALWTHGLTTAFMQGLNSLFSAVKRKARGYQTVEYMTTMLYFVSVRLTPWFPLWREGVMIPGCSRMSVYRRSPVDLNG